MSKFQLWATGVQSHRGSEEPCRRHLRIVPQSMSCRMGKLGHFSLKSCLHWFRAASNWGVLTALKVRAVPACSSAGFPDLKQSERHCCELVWMPAKCRAVSTTATLKSGGWRMGSVYHKLRYDASCKNVWKNPPHMFITVVSGHRNYTHMVILSFQVFFVSSRNMWWPGINTMTQERVWPGQDGR